MTYETETYDVGVWARPDPTGTSCVHTYGTDCVVCTWERDPYTAPCAIDPPTEELYWYKTGTETKVVEVVDNLPEATIAGTLQNCNEHNGWCTNAATLHLAGAEPLAGESILALEGTRNGEAFLCQSDSCDIPLVAGTNDFTFWALSSYGDSSRMGTLSAKVDAIAPEINGAVSGTPGENGWFISDVTLTASASDPTPGSGLERFESSLDGINWTAFAAPLTFSEGVYSLQLRAVDFAENTAQLTREIKVDSTPPEISAALAGQLGAENWYISPVQAEVQTADRTSGIALTEYRADGRNWQVYSHPLEFGDGIHQIQFRTKDAAGWISESEVFDFKIDATAPHIQLPSRWYIWESGEFVIKDETSKIVAAGYEIRDPQGRWRKVERNWTPDTEQFSQTIAWNRVFADGVVAPIGNYEVRVYAVDAAGNRSEKRAQILIPAPEATPLPTFTPVPTATIAPNTPVPTEMAILPAVEPTAAQKSEKSGFRFGSNDDSLEEEIPNSQSPNPQSPILWGATAAAALGIYAVTAEKRRKERRKAEAESLAAARNKAARLNEAERQRKINNYLQGQAILRAQEALQAQSGDDDPYEDIEDWYENQDKINAEMIAEVPELKRWAKKRKQARQNEAAAWTEIEKRRAWEMSAEARRRAYEVYRMQEVAAQTAGRTTELEPSGLFAWITSKADKAVDALKGTLDAWKVHHLQFNQLEDGHISVSADTPPGTRLVYKQGIIDEGFAFEGTRYNPETIASLTSEGLLKGAFSKSNFIFAGMVSLGQNMLTFGKGKSFGSEEYWEETVKNREFWVSTGVDFAISVAVGVAAAAIVAGAIAGLVALGVTAVASVPLWLTIGATAGLGIYLGYKVESWGMAKDVKEAINKKLDGLMNGERHR
ncbi:MAG: hypothetical protein L3J16_04985 [Anaerolineales bacterium]|nr:hypothetical protein [Anaerolineales bacterium]